MTCPACPDEVRNLFAVASNLCALFEAGRPAKFAEKFADLRQAVDTIRPIVAGHFHDHPPWVRTWVRPIERSAVADLIAERLRQDEKWGEQNHDPFTWLAILGEEVGESNRAALDIAFSTDHRTALAHLREELVQVGAVAVAFVECLDRGTWNE